MLNGAHGTSLERLVSTARVADLDAQAQARHLSGTTGISHTRWATHGAPSPVNAHPHLSGGEVAVVHNGIIENFEALRERLQAQGYAFGTQTDSETIAHLVHAHWHGAAKQDLLRAVQLAVAEFEGAYAIAVISSREPGRVVGARQGSPLVVGIGEDDHFLASDAAALVPVTRRVVYLDEGDVADVRTRELCDLRRARGSAWSARSSTCPTAPPPSSSGRIATSCRRRSSSSRAPWRTRSRASRASTPRSSATRPTPCSATSTRC